MEYEFEYDSEGSVEEYRDWWLDADQRSNLSDDEIVDKMVSDTLYHEESFELFIQDIGSLLERIDTHQDLYYISGENIGWRKRSGETIEQISTPIELVQFLTPNSGSFRIEYSFEDSCLYCRVFTHDSPSGSPFKVLSVDESVANAFDTGGRVSALERLNQ